MNKLMMVICDKEESEPLVLAKAKSIASPLHVDVKVLRFLPPDCSEDTRQSVTQSTDALAHSIFNGLESVSTEVISTDSIAGWIVDHSGAYEDKLVVKTGNRSESLFHTPTDWELIRQLDCPVLINSNRKWKSSHNVLVALDLPSDNAEHQELNASALHWARQWQAIFDCELHALYSIPVSTALLDFDIVQKSEYQRAHEPKAMEKLSALLDEFGMSNVTPHIQVGPPYKTIPHMANELKADLVIVGSGSHKGIKGFLHNHHTAEKVLHHLRTDILTVKPSVVSAQFS